MIIPILNYSLKMLSQFITNMPTQISDYLPQTITFGLVYSTLVDFPSIKFNIKIGRGSNENYSPISTKPVTYLLL